LDIFGASSNIDAHKAAFEIYTNPIKAIRIDFYERYMLALAQNPSPPENILPSLFEIGQNSKIAHDKMKETLLLTVGTLSRKTSDAKLSASVLRWLIKSLLTCKNTECCQVSTL
jgi:hypothetical protein